jgi:predicted DNA repair protein MutK
MSGGLFGLLDDVATLAKLAAASVDDVGAAAGRASVKAAGVVVDDTAVTPQYVQGIAAHRELPVVKRIAYGSIRNKLLFILPAALLLSQFLPQLLPVILMLGGTYLAFEGAEKVWERLRHHDDHVGDLPTPAVEHGPDAERKMIAGAIRTDLILSAEIMVIALAEVEDEPFLARLAILVVVAFVITIAVYGVVALIVKMDDLGLALTQRRSSAAQRVGRGLVDAMPKLLAAISVIGTVAMLWVGGHILLVNLAEVGWWHAPYDWVHHLEEDVHHSVSGFVGSTLGWMVNTAISAVVGLLVGAVVVLVMHLLPLGHGDAEEASEPPAGKGDGGASPA